MGRRLSRAGDSPSPKDLPYSADHRSLAPAVSFRSPVTAHRLSQRVGGIAASTGQLAADPPEVALYSRAEMGS